MSKSIDNCEETFYVLSTEVLPRYFSLLKENMQSPFQASWIQEQGVGQSTLLERLSRKNDFSGCYVFIEKGEPLYVGISRAVISRLFQHISSRDHYSGSLAYYMAKQEYDPGMTREENMGHPAFRLLFHDSQRRLDQCSIATVEIGNAVELHLFEVYAAMELGTGEFNTFRTH